uniref:Uncharacterized protein n=1 Tax=Rhizophora mucronata TaxID=61149 RepID=A0A2P2NJN0_RHIMU
MQEKFPFCCSLMWGGWVSVSILITPE